MNNKVKTKVSKKLLSSYFQNDNILEIVSDKTNIDMYDLYSIINYNYKFIADETFQKLSLYLGN
ncbi:hypothetical protein FEFB_09800 [Fructobacillus sp. EFB-N1]|nr:hypothetical protein FEFB_09800 [Fructobacillus sp. EFB-N1]